MTTKPWGDEPAISLKNTRATCDCGKEWHFHEHGGFTKHERACIDLKVPHPDLPPELRALILESRRLDYVGDLLTDNQTTLEDTIKIATRAITLLESK